MKKTTKKSWIWLGIALCVIAVIVTLICGMNSYELPVDPAQVETVSVYRGGAEDMTKKQVTDDEDIALITKKLNSALNLGGYKMPAELPVGGYRTDFVFHMKDGSIWACSVRDDLYYSDGNVRMRTAGGFLQKLWQKLDYPAELGSADKDGFTVPNP